MSNFRQYSAYYDLLYSDKNYEAEADYVARALEETRPSTRTILELGSGTGRHGRLLAGRGFVVHGVERSPEMVAVAEAAGYDEAMGAGRFGCEVGDICDLHLCGRFDAVIALFHVISYQTSNDALLASFRNAAEHLEQGGVFLFDVWHGPAVLTQRPSQRVREVSEKSILVKRTATPTLDTNRATVEVVYEMECANLTSGEVARFTETHVMRYLFPTEIDLLARASGMSCVRVEEFLTGRTPSTESWGVCYVLRK